MERKRGGAQEALPRFLSLQKAVACAGLSPAFSGVSLNLLRFRGDSPNAKKDALGILRVRPSVAES